MADEFTPEQVIEAYINGYPGMIRDYDFEEAFLASLDNPDFKYAAPHLLGDGKGKLSLPFLSVLEFDPNAYEEAQVTGDCLEAGTKVLMVDGTEKNIEDVKEGEWVISGENIPRKVISTLKKPYSGEMVTIKLRNHTRTITATPDHEFTWFPYLESGSRKDYKKKGNKNNDKRSEWKPCERLEVKERILVPYGHIPEKDQVLDIADYITDYTLLPNNRIIGNNGRFSCKRFIKVDENLAWLLGIYLAEGGTADDTHRSILFSLNRNETEYANRITVALKDIFDVDVGYTFPENNPNTMLVGCYRQIVAWFFKAIIPGNVYTKRPPNFIFAAPKKVKLALLRGWVDGDGHDQLGTKRKTGPHYYLKFLGTSACPEMVEDLYRLALSCEMEPKINIRKKESHQRVSSNNLTFYSDSVFSLYPDCEKHVRTLIKVRKNKAQVTEKGFAHPIKKITKKHVSNTYVYCIGVDVDHSFIANGIKSRNCVSHGARNAIDVTRAIQIVNGAPEGWLYRGATEAIYGARGHGGQGMDPGRAAKFVTQDGGIALRQKYGSIDLSRYNGNLGAGWGSRGVPRELLEVINKNKVGTLTRISNAEEAADALANGYGISVGSDVGFSSKRDENGFSRRSGSWNHQMSFTAADNTNGEFALLCQNSWGAFNSGPKSHGQPDGSFWVHEDDANVMLKQGGGYAYSMINGFPPQALPDYGTGSFF